MTNKLEASMKDFTNFLKTHEDILETAKQEENIENLMPRALDLLLDAEDEYFEALDMLYKKHKMAKTVDEIQRLTKEMKKICK